MIEQTIGFLLIGLFLIGLSKLRDWVRRKVGLK